MNPTGATGSWGAFGSSSSEQVRGNERFVHPLASSLLLLLRRLVELPGRALTNLADEADEIWEPFLLDDARSGFGTEW